MCESAMSGSKAANKSNPPGKIRFLTQNTDLSLRHSKQNDTKNRRAALNKDQPREGEAALNAPAEEQKWLQTGDTHEANMVCCLK